MLKYLKICIWLSSFIVLLISCCKETKDTTGWTSYTSFGLSKGVTGIAIDLQGDKWFATSEGIIKYDGINYTLYNDSNSGLVNKTVYCIAIDAQNNKWFGTLRGVSKFDGINWTTYLKDTAVWFIANDAKNNLWFSLRGGYGLLKFDGNKWTPYSTENSGLPTNFISTIAIDRKNNKWFADQYTGRVIRYNDTIWNTYSLPNPYPADAMSGVSAISTDISGNVWVVVPLSGVFKYDGANWTIMLKGESIRSLAIDTKDNKWIGYHVLWLGGGVSKYDDGKWINYNTDNSGIIDNKVSCITIDKQGDKWIGTNRGVSQFKD